MTTCSRYWGLVKSYLEFLSCLIMSHTHSLTIFTSLYSQVLGFTAAPGRSSSLSVCAVALLTVTCLELVAKVSGCSLAFISTQYPLLKDLSPLLFLLLLLFSPRALVAKVPRHSLAFFFSTQYFDFQDLHWLLQSFLQAGSSSLWDNFLLLGTVLFHSPQLPNLNSPCAEAQDMISLLIDSSASCLFINWRIQDMPFCFNSSVSKFKNGL